MDLTSLEITSHTSHPTQALECDNTDFAIELSSTDDLGENETLNDVPNDNLLEKALTLFLLKTKEVCKESQSALDGIVEDMGLFIETLVGKITSS